MFCDLQILIQGGRLLPGGAPAKLALILFWVVVMVLVATYNANLTAFLSVTRKVLPYRTLDEVIKSDHLLTLSEYTFIRNTFQVSLNVTKTKIQTIKNFIQENAFENVVHKMVAFFSTRMR